VRLRPRLALTVLGVGVPLIAGLAWARLAIEHSTAVDGLARLVLERMRYGGKEECDRWPESWPILPEPIRLGRGREGLGAGFGSRVGLPPRPERNERLPIRLRQEERRPRAFAHLGPPVEFFAYGADFISRNPLVPALPEELRTGLLAGQDIVSRGRSRDAGAPLEVALRMIWFAEPGSPSAVVMARQVGAGGPSLAHEFLLAAVIVASIMLLALFVSAGPVVARVRRLTHGVRRAATDRYATPVPVEGHDEVSELAEAFNAAGAELRAHTEALEQRERGLREFVEGTTHDVMLPLTVLQGHLVSLRRRASGDQAAILGDALEEAHYMASLVRNLGTAAKLETEDEAPRRDPVDLVALCERVFARHLPVAREKGVALEPVLPGEPVMLRGDGTLIEQAVSNLVHNAVRYVERGGRVLIVLSVEAGRFCLRVLDDGPGIPPDQLQRLTERRWRADAARTRHPDGSGLGLAIAHEVALRHGMELSLRSAPELGGLEAELRGSLG
jgi:signal transduction histidine kinase